LLGHLPKRSQIVVSRLFLILGEQLHPDPHPLLIDFNPASNELLMMEAGEESAPRLEPQDA
jgi:hypothetical protein